MTSTNSASRAGAARLRGGGRGQAMQFSGDALGTITGAITARVMGDLQDQLGTVMESGDGLNFDGANPSRFPKFISDFGEYADSLGITDAARRKALFVKKLSGVARSLYDMLVDQTSLTNIVAGLKVALQPYERAEEPLREVYEIRQGTEEMVQSFSIRILDAMTRSDLAPNKIKQNALTFFLAGLQSDIMAGMPPIIKTWEDAVANAVSIESRLEKAYAAKEASKSEIETQVQKILSERAGQSVAVTGSAQHVSEAYRAPENTALALSQRRLVEDMSDLKNMIGGLQNQGNSTQQEIQNMRGVINQNQRAGSSQAQNYPQNNSGNFQNRNYPPNNFQQNRPQSFQSRPPAPPPIFDRNGNKVLICYSCQREGHFARDCPNRLTRNFKPNGGPNNNAPPPQNRIQPPSQTLPQDSRRYNFAQNEGVMEPVTPRIEEILENPRSLAERLYESAGIFGEPSGNDSSKFRQFHALQRVSNLTQTGLATEEGRKNESEPGSGGLNQGIFADTFEGKHGNNKSARPGFCFILPKALKMFFAVGFLWAICSPIFYGNGGLNRKSLSFHPLWTKSMAWPPSRETLVELPSTESGVGQSRERTRVARNGSLFILPMTESPKFVPDAGFCGPLPEASPGKNSRPEAESFILSTTESPKFLPNAGFCGPLPEASPGKICRPEAKFCGRAGFRGPDPWNWTQESQFLTSFSVPKNVGRCETTCTNVNVTGSIDRTFHFKSLLCGKRALRCSEKSNVVIFSHKAKNSSFDVLPRSIHSHAVSMFNFTSQQERRVECLDFRVSWFQRCSVCAFLPDCRREDSDVWSKGVSDCCRGMRNGTRGLDQVRTGGSITGNQYPDLFVLTLTPEQKICTPQTDFFAKTTSKVSKDEWAVPTLLSEKSGWIIAKNSWAKIASANILSKFGLTFGAIYDCLVVLITVMFWLFGRLCGRKMGMFLFILTLAVYSFPRSSAGSPPKTENWKNKIPRLNTYLQTQWGVVISPAGFMFRAGQKLHVPLIMRLTDHEWVQNSIKLPSEKIRLANCTGLQECITLAWAKEVTCPHKTNISAEISKVKDEFFQAYNGLFDQPFYENLLDSFCAKSPFMCAQNQQVYKDRIKRRMDFRWNNSPTRVDALEKMWLRRHKRVVGLLIAGVLGLTGTALGAANTWQIIKAQDSIRGLQEAGKIMAANQEVQTEAIRKLTQADTEIYSFLHHSLDEMRASMAHTQCVQSKHLYDIQQEIVLLAFRTRLREALEAVTHSALEGVLRPELLNVQQLSELLGHYPEFQTSILAKQISLVYQFSKVYPAHLDFQNLIFAFLLEIPLPQWGDLGPVYSVENVGMIHEKLHQKLQLPSFASSIENTGRKMSALNEAHCEKKPGIWYCNEASFVAPKAQNDCLAALFPGPDSQKLVSDCLQKRHVKLHGETEVKTVMAGLLFRTELKTYYLQPPVVFSQKTQGKTVHVPEHGVVWIPYQNFSMVVIGNQSISTTAVQTDIINLTPPEARFTFHTPKFVIPPIDWVNLDQAEQYTAAAENALSKIKAIPPGLWNYHRAWYMIVASTVMNLFWVLLFVGCCCFAARKCYSGFRKKKFSDDVEIRARRGLRQLDEATDESIALRELVGGQGSRRFMSASDADSPRNQLKVGGLSANQIKTVTLLDTGADDSFMSTVFANKIGAEITKHKSVKITSASGHQVKIEGEAIIKIGTPKGHPIEHKVFVTDNSPNPLILGADFLRKFTKVCLNFQQKRVELGAGLALPILDETEDTESVISNLDTVTIPPHTQVILPGLVEQPHPLVSTALFNPSPHFQRKFALVLCYTLITLGLFSVAVPVVNSGDSAITIPKGAILGVAINLDQQQIDNIQTLKDKKGETQFCYFGKDAEKAAKKEKFVWKDPNPNEKFADFAKKFKEPISKVNLDDTDLNQSQKKLFLLFLNQHESIFSKDEYDLGYCDKIEIDLELKEDAKPVRSHPYRVPEAYRQQLYDIIGGLLKSGVLEESTSDFATPITLVPKKSDGSGGPLKLRFCADFRKVNQVLKPIMFPLPRMDSIFSYLGRKMYFTLLDLTQAFFQLKISDKSKPITAICTPWGLYQYRTLPMGLVTGSAHMQRAMSVIMSGLDPLHCLCYQDDIMIASSGSLEEHIESLDLVFGRLKEANLKIKVQKCKFAKSEIEYLGFIVGRDGIKPSPAKLESIREFPRPTDIKGVQSFLGMANFLRDCIPSFSKITAALTNILKGAADKRKFFWGEEQERSFILLKERLSSAPVVRFPDFSKKFFLSTDASGYGIGAVVTQEHDGKQQPVAYGSRKLTETQMKWPIIEKEAFAIKWAVTHFKHYFMGRPITIYTDHKPLVSMFSKPPTNSKVFAYSLDLRPYDYTLVYRAGKENKLADPLSRYPLSKNPEEEEEPIHYIFSADNNALPTPAFEECDFEEANFDTANLVLIGLAQSNDPKLEPMINYLRTGELPSCDHEARKILLTNEKYVWENEALFRLRTDVTQSTTKVLVVPKIFKLQFLHAMHSEPMAGHLGREKTYARIEARYYWEGIYRDVRNFVS